MTAVSAFSQEQLLQRPSGLCDDGVGNASVAADVAYKNVGVACGCDKLQFKSAEL